MRYVSAHTRTHTCVLNQSERPTNTTRKQGVCAPLRARLPVIALSSFRVRHSPAPSARPPTLPRLTSCCCCCYNCNNSLRVGLRASAVTTSARARTSCVGGKPERWSRATDPRARTSCITHIARSFGCKCANDSTRAIRLVHDVTYRHARAASNACHTLHAHLTNNETIEWPQRSPATSGNLVHLLLRSR